MTSFIVTSFYKVIWFTARLFDTIAFDPLLFVMYPVISKSWPVHAVSRER